MPTIPPNTINDLPREVRKEFQRLAYERSVLGYHFSYERLLKAIHRLAGKALDQTEVNSTLEACIIAWKDEEAKKVKDDLGDRITNIYVEHGIDKTLRDSDPFGRTKDYIMAEGVSVSFSQHKALELGVAGIHRWTCKVCGRTVFTIAGKPGTPCPNTVELKGKEFACKGKLDTEPKVFAFNGQALTALFALCTTKTKYVSLQARDAKEGNGR